MLVYILLIYTLLSIIIKCPIVKNRFGLLNSLKNFKNLKIETKNLDFSKIEDLLKLFIIIDATQTNSIETKNYSKKALIFADMSLKLKENIALTSTDMTIIENERISFIKRLNKVIVFDCIYLLMYTIVSVISMIYIFL